MLDIQALKYGVGPHEPKGLLRFAGRSVEMVAADGTHRAESDPSGALSFDTISAAGVAERYTLET